VAALRTSHERTREELAEINYELVLRRIIRKFRPDQPRVPAGSPQGGQWTSGASSVGDSAAGDTGADNLATGGDAGDAAQSDTSSNANTATFSPDKPGWHDYPAGPNLVCSPETRCPREEVTDQFARFSLPGGDPSMPVVDGGRYPVYIPGTDKYVGEVETTITEDGLAIANRTLPGHIFFDGVVVRRLTQSEDGAWYVTTHGFGNNVETGRNLANQLVGPEIFNELDRQMRANIERHHGKGAVLDLSGHRVDGGGRYGSRPTALGSEHAIP